MLAPKLGHTNVVLQSLIDGGGQIICNQRIQNFLRTSACLVEALICLLARGENVQKENPCSLEFAQDISAQALMSPVAAYGGQQAIYTTPHSLLLV